MLFALMGALIIVPLSLTMPQKMGSQILKRDVEIVRGLSREIQEPLLLDNKLALSLLLEERLQTFGDAIYIFVRGHDGTIIASTFKKGFPRGLININRGLIQTGTYNVQKTGEEAHGIEELIVDGKKAYDIAVPLLAGELGSLHVGVSLESRKAEVAEFTRINYYLAAIVIGGLAAGILVFALLGVFLSNRITTLKDFATKIGNGDLNGIINISTNDELGSLAASLNKMAEDLKGKIEVIKNLSYLEERRRIAIEFHDGLAQDVVDVIKRLELCQRLLPVDPRRVSGELTTLEANARNILDKTRDAISAFKSPREHDFSLLDSLSDYIKDYKQQTNINVKLNVCKDVKDIPIDKLEQIFYIIKEALTNIKNHSRAKNAELTLVNTEGELIVTIKDDGKGFDVNAIELDGAGHGKLGLIGMRQRANFLEGTLVIRSQPGQGTEISVNIPLEEKAD